jgi:hypothetical protein
MSDHAKDPPENVSPLNLTMTVLLVQNVAALDTIAEPL